MTPLRSDALVFFGATGELAYKKIFPSLQAMLKRGHLDIPVIGVAKAGWNLEQITARAKDSLEKHGGLDPAACARLSGLLRYVDGDYDDPASFAAIRHELGSAGRPAHHLAIPPVLFGKVVEQLGASGCVRDARVIVEKPFGTDLASARELDQILRAQFPASSMFRIDHDPGKRPVSNMLLFRFANAFMEPLRRPGGSSTRPSRPGRPSTSTRLERGGRWRRSRSARRSAGGTTPTCSSEAPGGGERQTS